MKKLLAFSIGLLICTSGFSQQKVGIGTLSPAFKLDVRNGSINTDSVYRIGAITVLAVPGDNNLFIGKAAGKVNTGYDNTFSGQQAGSSNTTGKYNSFFGSGSGFNNLEGDQNSFFGTSSGKFSEGSTNSFFGSFTGFNNTTGTSNVFFGSSAGYSNTEGNLNSFFGNLSGWVNTTGTYNTAVGFVANFNSGGLTNANAIGTRARVDCSNCMVLGSVIDVNGALASVNVGIGINSPIATLDVARGTGGYGTAAFRGTMHISHFSFGDDEDTYIRAGKDNGNVILNDIPGGNVGIGTNNPNVPLSFPSTTGKKISLYDSGGNSHYGFSVEPSQLQMYTDGAGGRISFGYYTEGVFTELMFLDNASGDLTIDGSYYDNSDLRLKTDILPLQNSLAKITQLHGYNYHWKNENADQDLQTGVVAQEVQSVFPELVKEDKEGMLSVNYSGLIPVLIESIKEQQKQIDELKQLVLELAAKN